MLLLAGMGRLGVQVDLAAKGLGLLLGGAGLGLAIVKHILTRHRGRLEVESEPGQGATFKVSLPAMENVEGLPEKISA